MLFVSEELSKQIKTREVSVLFRTNLSPERRELTLNNFMESVILALKIRTSSFLHADRNVNICETMQTHALKQ